MDFKEKLEKAAFDFMLGATYPESACGYLREVFESGAEWLQSQPIADRLTEEDVDKLNNIMFLMRGMAASHQMSYDCLKQVADAIYDVFGKEIFEKQSRYAVVNPAFFGR